MTTNQQSSGQHSAQSVNDASIQPFTGVLFPGICFESGHCFCLYKWWETPTSIDEYESLWIITPDGERRLYGDCPEAVAFVQKYHEFDQTHEAEINWITLDEDRLECSLAGEDGTSLDLRLDLGSSIGTRLLGVITTVTPTRLLRTSVGETISNLTFGLLLDTNGLKVAGNTDTSEPYRVESDSLRIVTSGLARLNDEDCGDVVPPDRLIEFGDAIVPNDPLVSFGELWLRPPPE